MTQRSGQQRAMATWSLVALGAPSAAYANIGVPMLAVVWPVSWALLVPVVLLEAWFARKLPGMPPRRAVLATATANVVSTLAGIPLVWALLLAADFMLGGDAARGIDTLWLRVYAVTVQAPWLIPYESELDWMVPAAAIVLLVPFFFASVFIERAVFLRFYRSQPELVRRWSWRANLASYGLLLAVLVGILAAAVLEVPTDPWRPR